MEPRIFLVNPPGNILIDEHLEPPLGLISIASYLQKTMGLRAVVLDLTKFNIEQAQEVLLAQQMDIVGFTVYCTKWKIVKDLIHKVREKHGVRPLIVVGGPNPTAIPQTTLDFEQIDLVVCGEGEKAFCQIVAEFQQGRLDRSARKIMHGQRLKDVEFPMLDRTFVEPPEKYSRRCFDQPVVTLEASRGCRNKCFFCNSTVMGGGARGGIVGKPYDLVVQEILESKKAGHQIFRFNDDTFTYAAHNNGLLEQIEKVGVQYRIFANVKHLTEDVLQALKRSGCFHISVGVESFNPENLRIIGKKTDQAEIRSGINRAHELGITVRAYFIVGLPFDTYANIEKYMTMVSQDVDFDEYSIYPLIPYPGTAIWNQPEKFGYSILDKDFDDYIQIGKGGRTAFVLNHQNFSAADVATWLLTSDEIFAKKGKIQTLKSKVV
jgi:anaerobic magnesium-protoporphyrin IX monomethyl ester cyclase